MVTPAVTIEPGNNTAPDFMFTSATFLGNSPFFKNKFAAGLVCAKTFTSVSYTHLTLPTKA